MTNVQRKTVQWIRHEFQVPAKGNNRDLYDALAMAMNHLEQVMGLQAIKYDDALHYEVSDEFITVYWIEHQNAETKPVEPKVPITKRQGHNLIAHHLRTMASGDVVDWKQYLIDVADAHDNDTAYLNMEAMNYGPR